MKQTDEERRLGLDPEKYTKKPWNPDDYIGWSKQSNVNPEFELSSEQEQLKKLREQYVDDVEGGSIPKMNKNDLIDAEQKAWFSRPQSLYIIKKLGLETKDGIPVLSHQDESLLHQNNDEPKPSHFEHRSQLLKQLLQGE